MPSWESGMTAWPVGVHLPTAPRFGSGGNGRPGTDAGRQGRISRFRVTEPPKTLGGCTLSQFRAEMQRITRSQQRIFCALSPRTDERVG